MPGNTVKKQATGGRRGGLEQEDSRVLMRLIYVSTGLTIGFFAVLQGVNGNLPLAVLEGAAVCYCLAAPIGSPMCAT